MVDFSGDNSSENLGKDPLGSLEDAFTEDEKAQNVLRQQIHAAAALWPEFLAMWSGMVQSAIDDGWEETAARALVLTSITGAMNVNVLANLKSDSDGTEPI